MNKRLISLILSVVMLFGTVVSVYADEEDDIRAQQAQAEEQLGDTYQHLDNLAAMQQEIQAQISAVNADLVDLMVQINQAEADIQATKDQISVTMTQIADTEGQIAQTLLELEEANQTRDQQYEDMTNRIQFIYENGGSFGWATIVLKADSLSSFLNRAEYASQLENADRLALNAYEKTIKEIEQAEAALEEQKAGLQEQQNALQNQQALLEAQEAELQVQRADLEAQLEAKKATSADYENQIAEARSQAAQIEELIRQQQAEIDRIEAEKAEAARRAAEEAARRAAEEEAARQAAAARAAAEAAVKTGAGDSDGNSFNLMPSGNGSGIVSYACQFVGCPYVWGGNSLTHGCDCSHFVWNVLRNCGVYSGPYLTSGGWAGVGRPVPSLSQAQAGDVIVYSGHVAIYDGNGMIVEAKGAAYGITHNRRADYKGIVAIRRFI